MAMDVSILKSLLRQLLLLHLIILWVEGIGIVVLIVFVLLFPFDFSYVWMLRNWWKYNLKVEILNLVAKFSDAV